ncbi:hypothetical protein QLS71_017500 [Mariniflexile litorale]|uniref:Uncharacterized protein n=1 Tax=Mariniflexile litorale TaxID=3045158 RepID=A0AAU7EES8_9FLAO|nr:hypothetical protein [Mariniflexile sp. KMM 9835]MDQ8211643.1 hypothetical protein [Mariniflexile sp. KMM 9835]
MKLITSISLSILFMFQAIMPNIDMGCEFQKIAAIYSHYQEHKTFDGDTFLDFVLEDYILNDGSSKEHHENSNHHEAPLHNSHQCCSHVTFFFPQQSQFILEPFRHKENLKFDYYKVFLSSTYLDTLFQPPRV